MSAKLQQILDDSHGLIAIPGKFDKLITVSNLQYFDDRGSSGQRYFINYGLA